jgi:hypothetical protein
MHGPELAFIGERVGREVVLGDDEGQQRVANVLQPLVAARASVEGAAGACGVGHASRHLQQRIVLTSVAKPNALLCISACGNVTRCGL